jgi:RecJ-like exonuclease
MSGCARWDEDDEGDLSCKCIACNGSGYYDNTGNPKCGSCNGTGNIQGVQDSLRRLKEHIEDLEADLFRYKSKIILLEAKIGQQEDQPRRNRKR